MFIFLVFPCNSDIQMILYSIMYAKNFRKRSIREICYYLVKYIEKGRDLERINLLLSCKIYRERAGFRAYLFSFGFNLSLKCYQINRMRNGINFCAR